MSDQAVDRMIAAVLVPVTGAEVLQLFAVVSSGTATVSYLFPS